MWVKIVATLSFDFVPTIPGNCGESDSWEIPGGEHSSEDVAVERRFRVKSAHHDFVKAVELALSPVWPPFQDTRFDAAHHRR